MVVDLEQVSRGERLLLGTLAARAGMVVDVEMIDMKEGKTIGAFRAEGKSSGKQSL